MSWPPWPAAGIPPVPVQPAISPAQATAPPGMQYTPEQWAQLQQQNWTQWAQWQQQYQQWHQQYGAEYQKSMTALAQPTAMTNVTVPPPLPNTNDIKPPLPADDPPPNVSYSTVPPTTIPPPGYTSAPSAEQNFNKNRQPINRFNNEFFTNKREFDQGATPDPKRHQNSRQNWGPKAPFQPASKPQFQPPPPNQANFQSNFQPQTKPPAKNQFQAPSVQPLMNQQRPPPLLSKPIDHSIKSGNEVKKETIDELSEAERKFDKQFADWEMQFNKWKEQNAEHPDKNQYREYEKKWESWRAQLLDRREQMKRKRLALQGGATSPQIQIQPQISIPPNRNEKTFNNDSFCTPPPQFNQPPPFLKPPPTHNDEPLKFKPLDGDGGDFLKPSIQNDEPLKYRSSDGDCGDFLKPTSSGGIPGLDLVKDENKVDLKVKNKDGVDLEPEKKSGPDFEAISKGINNILTDQKLMNMLSMVSQNQSALPDQQTNAKVQENEQTSNQSFAETQSNQSESFNQREFVNNFDEQTRSSFTTENNKNRFDYNEFNQPRFNKFESGPDFEQNQQKMEQFNKFDQGNQYGNQFNKNQQNFNKFEPGSGVSGKNQQNFNQFDSGPDFNNSNENQSNFNKNEPGLAFNQQKNQPNFDRFDSRSDFNNPNRNQLHFNKNESGPPFNQRNFNDFESDDFNNSNENQQNFNNFDSRPDFNKSNRSQLNFNKNEQKNQQNFNMFESGPDFNNTNNKNFNKNEPGPFKQQKFNKFESGPDFNNPNKNFNKNEPGSSFNQQKFNQFESGPGFNNPNKNFNKNEPGPCLNQPNFNKFESGPDFNNPIKNFNRNKISPGFNQQNFNQFESVPDFTNSNKNEPGPGFNQQNVNKFESGPDFNKPNKNFNKFETDPDINNPNQNFNKNESGGPLFNKRNQQGLNKFDTRADFNNPTPNQANFNKPGPGFNKQNQNFNQFEADVDFDEPQSNFDNFDEFTNQPNRFDSGPDFDNYGPPPPQINEKDFTYDDYENLDNFDSYNNEEWVDENYDGNEEEWQNEDEQITENYVEEVTESEELLRPETIIDYEHKSIKVDEPEVLIEPIYMFDYRHKPFSRIPLPQRPNWLSEAVRFIHEFDPPLVRAYELPSARRYPPSGEQDWRQDGRQRQQRQGEGGGRVDSKRNWGFERRPEVNANKGRNSSWERDDNVEMELEDADNISEPDWDDDGIVERVFPSMAMQGQMMHASVDLGKNISLIEDVINFPGRQTRPPKIVIILRGPPGSGKTFLAKLIKDRELENGGSAPRILSLDDYFMVEQEKDQFMDGSNDKGKEMIYEYEAEMEETYRASLTKAFRKTVTDGYFNFIIVDNVNEKVKYFGEMWSFAKQSGFQVYICQLDLDVQTCVKRNIHGRSEAEIEKCVSEWEPTPAHHPSIDATGLLQSVSIAEVEMEEVNSPDLVADEEKDTAEDQVDRSKWDNIDFNHDNLAKLDGVSKPLRSRTMEEYLKLEEEWTPTKSTKPGEKRVRWADLEEQREQEKMRAVGFVVGHTNWNRMLDPTKGSSALTQTKYIERTGKFKLNQRIFEQ